MMAIGLLPNALRVLWYLTELLRFLILAFRAKLGGLFVCERTIFNLGRVVMFRPDQVFHALTKVEDGVLYMLSFGFVTNKGNTNA